MADVALSVQDWLLESEEFEDEVQTSWCFKSNRLRVTIVNPRLAVKFKLIWSEHIEKTESIVVHSASIKFADGNHSQ